MSALTFWPLLPPIVIIKLLHFPHTHIPVVESSRPDILLKDFITKGKLAFIDCINVFLRYAASKIGVSVRKYFNAIVKSH